MWSALLLSLPLTSPAPPTPDLRLPLQLPVPTLQQVLTQELHRTRRDLLDDFQVVTSKFHDGRLILTGLSFEPTPTHNRLSFELHADLDFARRQLGVKWRGLKSHKKWYDRGRKVVARLRLRGTLDVTPTLGTKLDEASIDFRLRNLQVKLTSRIRPVRGLDLRFRVADRVERWDVSNHCPRGLLGWHLTTLDLTPVVREGRTTRVDVDVRLRREHELLPRDRHATEHQ